ncbi:general stress protein [Pseudobacillus wudalianchiensis]|uniref:General stress protein 17M-like domain-containing protein n=1 Tax=Pseudobacillus wudalianchiensis TaxID=1743143 RepID=A0A1B9AUE3_9BACI|nr:general stress protein [Bacillus wudalianchiensis]OCA87453.1 hypothetical protein A8F95_09510 [Bacillus wudalianchiensis]
MEKRIIGVYETEKQAQTAVENLQRKGYSLEQISIVAKNIEGLESNGEQVELKETEGMMAGATAGGIIGLAGFFVGMSALALPGIGPIIAAGPLLLTLGGAVSGAVAKAGDLNGALLEIGLEEEEARRYEEDVKKGKILVVAVE